MKNIIFSALCCLFSVHLSAQCNCDFQVEIIQHPSDPCCFDVLLCNNGGINCNPSFPYTQLTIYSGSNSSATAPISSVTSTVTNLVASQPGIYQANFATNFNLLSLNCNAKVNVGKICIGTAPNSMVQFTAKMDAGGFLCDIPLPMSLFNANCPDPIIFESMCGDIAENRPTAVKAFGDGLYVSGYRVLGGNDFGTFAKYDLVTGSKVWEKQLPVPSRVLDFEYDPGTDELLLVGHTTPLNNTFNNLSFWLKINDTGNLVFSNYYDQDGREAFTRIVRHPNPFNSIFPFYILGRKNPSTSAPSPDDVVVAYNVNSAGVVNWSREYAFTNNPTDDEFFLGLIPFLKGNLILTGLVNHFNSNDGAVIEIDGASGTIVQGYSYPHNWDIYDGILLPDDRFAIVGEEFGSHEAFVAILDPVNGFNLAFGTSYLQFPNIVNFKDIWQDQYRKLYVIGESKNPLIGLGLNYQVVHKLDYFVHAGVSRIRVDTAAYLEDNFLQESDFDNGQISVTPSHDRIFYADARLKNQPFFGSWDMLVGSYDLTFNSPCAKPFPTPTTSIVVTTNAIPLITDALNVVPVPTSNIIQNLTSCCTNFCSSAPCTANFTWSPGECFQLNFLASSSTCLTGTYTYEWDFDGDSFIDFTTFNPVTQYTFPCGGGVFNVCLTITDPLGCTVTVCYMVNVSNVCCGQITSDFLECTDNADEFAFEIIVVDPSFSTNCTHVLTFNSPVTGAQIVYDYSSVPGGVKITGLITVPSTPLPASLTYTVQVNCICPSGLPYVCTLTGSVPTLCCKRIIVFDQSACENDAILQVPIVQFIGNLNNIGSVSWFVMPKPVGGCPSVPWGGQAYSIDYTGSLTPLTLFPVTMADDVCIYAVVNLNDGPCTQIFTNIAMVQLCRANICTLNDSSYCYFGSCIVPGPITLTLNSSPTNCPFSVQWFDHNNSLVQTNGLTYQPTTPLCMQNDQNCYEDFFYTAIITDSCGQYSCQSRVRLYSDNAPAGSLIVDPTETLPLCPGGDATLVFMPDCAGTPPNPKEWFWCISNDGINYTSLNAGDKNPFWNTNPLFQQTWYGVKTQNGVCPFDTVTLDINVRDPLQITFFDVIPDDFCTPTHVLLEVQFIPFPDPLCPVEVDWYKDGALIGTTISPAASPSFFTYFPPANKTIDGNYYCVIKNTCCEEEVTSHLVKIDPIWYPEISGPCFICDNKLVTLNGIILNPPPGGLNCTYLWTTSNGTIVGPANGLSVTVSSAGIYLFTATCTDANNHTCIKSQSKILVGCTSAAVGGMCRLTVGENMVSSSVYQIHVYPNPTNGEIVIELPEVAKNEMSAVIMSLTGEILFQTKLETGTINQAIDLGNIPVGLYFLQINSNHEILSVNKIVKQ